MNDRRTIGQTLTLVVVLALLVLTAIDNAELMFWTSLVSLLLLFAWFVADRKVWLAAISGVTFVFTALSSASSLF